MIEDILIQIREELKRIRLNDRCKCCRCDYPNFKYPEWIYNTGTKIYTDNDTLCHGLEIFDTAGDNYSEHCKHK